MIRIVLHFYAPIKLKMQVRLQNEFGHIVCRMTLYIFTAQFSPHQRPCAHFSHNSINDLV